MSINIIFAFFSIFIGNKTTNLENMNEELVFKIKKIEEELNINQIELAIYNDNNYLRKLDSIYNSNQNKLNKNNVISFSEFSNIKNKELLKAGLK